MQSVRAWVQEAQAKARQASRTLLSYVGVPQDRDGLSFSDRIMSMRETLVSSQHNKKRTSTMADEAKIKILKVIGRGSVSND